MITVEFLGPIGLDNMNFEANTLAELSNILKSKVPEVSAWLSNSAVAVNDTIVKSLDIELKNGDRVSLLPPVCGG